MAENSIVYRVTKARDRGGGGGWGLGASAPHPIILGKKSTFWLLRTYQIKVLYIFHKHHENLQ